MKEQLQLIARGAFVVLIFAAVVGGLLWLPEMFHSERPELAVSARLFIIVVTFAAFVRLGFMASGERGSVSIALLIFTAGLVVELGTFARLYQQHGVLVAVEMPLDQADRTSIVYQNKKDFASCFLLSAHVWTSVGYGSYLPNDKHGWISAAEMLFGYVYMAIFIAILVAVLHQHFQRRVGGR